MQIVLTQMDKSALIKALKMGKLDTEKIPTLHKKLLETGSNINFKNLSEEELDKKIIELERKMYGRAYDDWMKCVNRKKCQVGLMD